VDRQGTTIGVATRSLASKPAGRRFHDGRIEVPRESAGERVGRRRVNVKEALVKLHRTAMIGLTIIGAVVGAAISVSPARGEANSSPIGFHDVFEGEVGPSRCAASGWAVDPDDRYTDLSIRILADGLQVAEGVANVFRQDLLDAGVSPDGISGFDFNLWDRVTLNEPHLISAQARDAQTLEWVDLASTPKQLTCSTAINETPIGFHDAFEGEVGPARCVATGWAVDPNNRFTDLRVRILADGVQVAEGVANMFRQDLLDAGVSPDGISSYAVNLWGSIALNAPHVISVQAQDAQTMAWVDLESTPKQLTCVGAIPGDAVNPRMSYFRAECDIRGLVDVTAVFPPNDETSTRTFHVVGTNMVFIIHERGPDKQADDHCVFGWTGGREPPSPWNRVFEASVVVVPKEARSA
jgi:hypothetical protein